MAKARYLKSVGPSAKFVVEGEEIILSPEAQQVSNKVADAIADHYKVLECDKDGEPLDA